MIAGVESFGEASDIWDKMLLLDGVPGTDWLKVHQATYNGGNRFCHAFLFFLIVGLLILGTSPTADMKWKTKVNQAVCNKLHP